jgi:hypothetical protein
MKERRLIRRPNLPAIRLQELEEAWQPRQTPRDPLDPEAQAAVDVLSSQVMPFTASAIYLELPPEPDEEGRPTPLKDRHSGVPSDGIGNPDDAYRYIVAPLLRDQRAADRAAGRRAQHVGELRRVFVTVGLRKALAADGTHLRALSEALLRNRDPAALQYLRAFRDRGVDIVLVRGAKAKGLVAVIFTGAIGDSIQVLQEAVRTFNRDEARWEGPRLQHVPSSRFHATAPTRTKRGLRRIGQAFILEVTVALFCHLAAPVLGVDVTVPLWLLISMFFLPPVVLIYSPALQRAAARCGRILCELSSVPRRLLVALRDFEEIVEDLGRERLAHRADHHRVEDHEIDLRATEPLARPEGPESSNDPTA